MEVDVGIPCSVISMNGNLKGDVSFQGDYDPTGRTKWPQETLLSLDAIEVQATQNSEIRNDTRESVDVISQPRQRRPTRPFSPDIEKKRCSIKTQKPLKKHNTVLNVSHDNLDSFINSSLMPPIRCDKCQSPYAIDPAKRKKQPGNKLSKPKFRKRLDVTSNKILTLCNKCGLSMSRVKKRPPKKAPPTEYEKNQYNEEAEAFALSLAERLNEPDAKRLYCPNYKSGPCGCLQKYIRGEGGEDPTNIDQRAMNLIQLLKTAKHLSAEKMQTVDPSTVNGNVPQKEDTILCRGIGNRHSKTFEDFVLSNRQSLREELNFCERASQRVLMYSNNFLHKELKSMKNQRLERKTGKYAKGLLKPIAELPLSACCSDKCVQLASTHPKQLELWRLGAQGGQQEARRVLAEMLSSRGSSKSNCYRFISLVTGCSFSTICSVSNQIKRSSESGDPPEHGLKKWWRENPKKRRKKYMDKKSPTNEEKCIEDCLDSEAAAVDSDLAPRCSLPLPPYGAPTMCSKEAAVQVEAPNDQLLELQNKVKMQELQLKQQQEIIERQMQQTTHSSITSASSSIHSTIQQLLLSPDIGAVTVLAASKSISESMQISTLEEITKGGVMVSQNGESSQGINSDNIRQMIQLYQPTTSSTCSVIESNYQRDKLMVDIDGTYSMLQPVADRISNCNRAASNPEVESIQPRQLLHVLEIPCCESLPHSTGDGGGACMRSIVLLPETIVLDPSMIGSRSNVPPSMVSHHTL